MIHEKENEQYAYFCIEEFPFAPEEMTTRIGIEPSTSWRKGDIHPKSRFEIKLNRWMLYSRLNKKEELESHIKDVLDQLDTREVQVLAACAEFGAYIQLVGYFYQVFPGLNIDRKETARVGKYYLGLDCDFYYLYEHRREGTD